MKERLRIVFMGTPEFAVHVLEAVLQEGFEIAGVVTAPDKPAGRGRKISESAVKKFAAKKGLNILQPTNLKSEVFLKDLKKLNADVQVVVAFRMLPAEVWKTPRLGTFNLHASLLPQYRGAAPINWAIINGETQTGVSTFFIDEKIDTGEMILQEKVAIDAAENAGSLHDKLMRKGSSLVIRTLEKLAEGDVKTSPQKEEVGLKTAYKLTRENTRINWEKPGREIFNLIRGLSPYPAAWTILQNGNQDLNIKIYAASEETESHSNPIGKVLATDGCLKVAVVGGYIIPTEVQFPGKKKMKTKDLLNGYSIYPNAKML